MTFQEIAREANRMEDELGITTDDVLNKLTQEVGEFNDAVQKYRGRYSRNKTTDTNNIAGELGDVLFNLISLCQRLGISVDELQQYPQATLEKFTARVGEYR